MIPTSTRGGNSDELRRPQRTIREQGGSFDQRWSFEFQITGTKSLGHFRVQIVYDELFDCTGVQITNIYQVALRFRLPKLNGQIILKSNYTY